MNNKQKFVNFLESLKGNAQDNLLIENIKKGFCVCEAVSPRIYDPNHLACKKCGTRFSEPNSVERLNFEKDDPDADTQFSENGMFVPQTGEFIGEDTPFPLNNDLGEKWDHNDYCANCGMAI